MFNNDQFINTNYYQYNYYNQFNQFNQYGQQNLFAAQQMNNYPMNMNLYYNQLNNNFQ